LNNFPSHRPKQIEFIEQRKKSDCGIACAAMLSDRLYGEVAAITQALGISARRGICLDQMFELLEELACNCWETDKLPVKGRALVTVQWKEKELSGHYVVWDSRRKQFLDPLHGVVNKKEMLKLAEIDSIWKVTK
jgi:ABC-type bacteriocin/lantibiotic exporter with double-glycine peptidase domain